MLTSPFDFPLTIQRNSCHFLCVLIEYGSLKGCEIYFLLLLPSCATQKIFQRGGGPGSKDNCVCQGRGGPRQIFAIIFFYFYLYFLKFRNTIFFNIMSTFNISNHFLFIPLSFTHLFKNKSKRT